MLKPIEEAKKLIRARHDERNPLHKFESDEEFERYYQQRYADMFSWNKQIPKRYEKATAADVPDKVSSVFPLAGKDKNGIYLWGGVGTGKTHVLYSLQMMFAPYLIEFRVANMTELLAEIRKSFDDKESRDILDEKCDAYDDIGAEKESDWVGEQVYRLVNDAYESKRGIVFTSNLPLNELAQRFGIQGDRIASRIAEMCHVIELKGNDRRV